MRLPEVQRLAVGQLLANCFVVKTAENSAVIIDPGDEAERICAYLEKNKLTPRKIFLTHGHFDHMNAAAQLKEKYKIPVYIHEGDACMLSDPEKALAYFIPGFPYHAVTPDVLLKEGDKIEQDGFAFEVWSTPGHSKGSVCYVCGDEIFAGDTIFCGSVGRTDCYSGSPAEQAESMARLAALSGDYVLYCGHGENTTLSAEKAYNPFMP